MNQISSADLFGSVEFAENPEPRVPCVLVVDTSTSMHGPRIDELNKGLQSYRDELQADPLAAKRVEVAIVTFVPPPTIIGKQPGEEYEVLWEIIPGQLQCRQMRQLVLRDAEDNYRQLPIPIDKINTPEASEKLLTEKNLGKAQLVSFFFRQRGRCQANRNTLRRSYR